MFKYSLDINKKYIFVNILIIVQISAVLILNIITVSSVMSRVDDYLPIRKILKQNGKCVYTTGMYSINGEKNIFTVQDILNIKNVSQVYSQYNSSIYPSNTDDYNCTYSYSKNMAELYIPEMRKGKWLNEANAEAEMLEVVISDSYNCDIGDIIKFSNLDDDKKEYSAKVIGIISDGTKVLGLGQVSRDYIDFRDMYTKNNNYCFFSYEQLAKQSIGQNLCGQIFITYKDNLKDSEILDLNREMYNYGATYGLADEVNINSLNYIKSDIMLIFPITLCLLILTIISEIATAAIQAKKELKTYGVFCVCGSTGERCSLINLGFSGIMSILSVILTITFFIIGKKTFLKNTIVSLGPWQLITCSCIIIFYVLLSIIIPFTIIKRNELKDILK